mgnify:CR=1 FL=1
MDSRKANALDLKRSWNKCKATKEEKKRSKDQARAARLLQRQAYLRGDESALPMRDRGPEKKFVRNYIDSRRSIGEYFLPIIGFVLVLSLIPLSVFAVAGIVIMYSVLLVSIVDGFFLSRKIKAEITARFPDKSTKGLDFTAGFVQLRCDVCVHQSLR